METLWLIVEVCICFKGPTIFDVWYNDMQN